MIEGLDEVVAVAGAHADEVDQRARFPRETVDALGAAGLLALTIPREFGGRAAGPVEAFEAVSAVGEQCASSAMVYTMHLAAVALLSLDTPRFGDVLREAAQGRHLSTLALSERATRSNFWVAMGSAEPLPGGGAHLSLEKSFVTSAGPANSYVVSAATPGRDSINRSDLFLVQVDYSGVKVLEWWQGSGLRGNSSAPMRFECDVPAHGRIGAPGEGQRLLLDVAIPWFQLCAASVSVGIARAAAVTTRDHVLATRLDHLDQRLADQPVVRFGLGQLYAQVDSVNGFVASVARKMADATATTRDVLALKAVANEVALEATDRAMRLGGGAAYSGRTRAERLFRDARAGTVMAPTADMLYDMIGRVAVGLPPV